MSTHPLWLVAFGLLGVLLCYIAAVALYHRDGWRTVAPAALAGLALITAVTFDAFGLLS